MAVITRCLHCGAQYKIPDHIAGKKFRCKHCHNVIDSGDESYLIAPEVEQSQPAPSSPMASRALSAGSPAEQEGVAMFDEGRSRLSEADVTISEPVAPAARVQPSAPASPVGPNDSGVIDSRSMAP
ncbi:MAG: hypothetical protein JXR97_15065, partial [Planctomycetes bacterium]|nr:hypothetical protein [Planctomycetota bacterium]